MQLRGRTVVVGIFVLAILMAGGAWWRRLQESRHAAAYWGEQGAPLVVGNTKMEFLVLGDAAAQDQSGGSIAGRPIAQVFDLSEQRGVVHLRYALTQDANFEWNNMRDEPLDADREWAYALRFSDDARQLAVLLSSDLATLGKVDADAGQVKVIPCPHLATKLKRYLTDVKAPLAP